MSLFDYKGIEMDIDNEFWSDADAKNLADKLIDIFNGTAIPEIYLEDDEYGQLFVEAPEDADLNGMMNRLAEEHGIGSSFSDFDYGDVEAINLYFKMNTEAYK